jgi:hypothetical protein
MKQKIESYFITAVPIQSSPRHRLAAPANPRKPMRYRFAPFRAESVPSRNAKELIATIVPMPKKGIEQ